MFDANGSRPNDAGRFKNLGHLENRVDVPLVTSTLTHGPKPIIVIPPESQKKILAARVELSRFYVFNLQGDQASPIWFHVIAQGIRAGLTFAGYYTVSRSVIDHLIFITTDSAKNKSKKQESRNNEVFKEIISESIQIDWFKNIVAQCVALNATDIHIEARGDHATIRVRRDGIMRTIDRYLTDQVTQALSSAFNLLAEERSRSEAAYNVYQAQSALIPIDLDDKSIALRYQSHPSVGGFDAIFRILETGTSSRPPPKLSQLGYTEDQIVVLNQALSTANGGVFVAGVTGSGKTTTLNAMLTSLAANSTRKIISIEDPVEYQIPGVSQLSIQRTNDPNINSFSPAMMAFLRMDPDVGMFGEIRDSVSGKMAYTAIQTGHKLLTTVHATSALGIISRLCASQIGLPREDICTGEFISALVYQGLVPTNCPQCKVPASSVMSSESLQIYVTLFNVNTDGFYCASENGCPNCCPPNLKLREDGHNGIKGMKVSAEIIRPDPELYDLLRRNDAIKGRQYWRRLQTSSYMDPSMKGKPAWAHTLFDVTQGVVDPYYFQHQYGDLTELAYL